MAYAKMAQKLLEGDELSRDEALQIVRSDDSEILEVMAAAFRVRQHFHGKGVKVHVLQNAKSGVCPEDCKFCSQSLKNNSDVEQYGMQTVQELIAGAQRAAKMGASTFCMVTSTRGPSSNEIKVVCEAVRQIKAEFPQMGICTSLGLLKPGQAEALADAGVNRYNHNVESSQRHFETVVSTHKWEDRVATVKAARSAGMQACCGGILGMGESSEDWVDMALALREIGVESVPLNFLDPRPGTPLSESPRMSPNDCLRALAMFRMVNPASDLRVAGGREVTLKQMQPMALYAANSIFTNGYLTTPGAKPSDDMQMILDAGFEPFVANVT